MLCLEAMADGEELVSNNYKRASRWRQPEWARYSMSASKRGPTYVHCNICSSDFSVAGGGFHEVKRHTDTRKHQENARGMSDQPTITSTLLEKKLIRGSDYSS